MRFAHSFWSMPLIHSKFSTIHDSVAINLVEYALSVEYIHKYGYEIDLYTDEDGAKLFELIPYDNVYIIKNTITDNYHFAASFKFLALERMDLDTILIDGDIFLKKQEVYSILENDKSDVVVSLFEKKTRLKNTKYDKYMFKLFEGFIFKEPYTLPKSKDCDGWYNTSLIKFNNQELKNEFIRQYKENIQVVKDKDFENIWPDIVLEQLNLTLLCKARNYSVGVVMSSYDTKKAEKEALEIGFTHIWGAKFESNLQMQNIFALEHFNKSLIEKLNDHVVTMTQYFEKKANNNETNKMQNSMSRLW